MFVVLICVSLVLCGVQAKALECGECKRSDCPALDRSTCLTGVIRDGCDCCLVCARGEGEACDLETSPFKFGSCGDHLECKSRKDDNLAGFCACRYDEVVCGTDGQTYENFCKLAIVKKQLGKEGPKVKSSGRCFLSKILKLDW